MERTPSAATGSAAVRRDRAESLLASENRILEHIASGAPLDVVATDLCAAIEDLAPGTRCAIRIAPAESRSTTGPVTKGAPANPQPVVGVNVFGTISEAGIIPPLVSERRIVTTLARDRADQALRRREVASYWVEPIQVATGAPLGVLAAYRQQEGAPSAHDLECSVAVARLAAIAIERVRADELARQQLGQLAHVARLATMGEMASGLAHELNQPLCAIVNFAEACVELLATPGTGTDELRKALGEVAKQAERAGEVIRRLREFVRWRELQRELVDVNHIVREVVGLTNVEVRHREIRVRLTLARDLPRVPADPVQIQQVIVNLIRNASDAMNATDVARRTLTIRTARSGGSIEVSVADAGQGVPDGGTEQLFEPFFSTKRDGMGMGLSISRSIVEAHGGRIWVTPNRQGGATFRFTLPTAARRKRGRTADRIRS